MMQAYGRKPIVRMVRRLRRERLNQQRQTESGKMATIGSVMPASGIMTGRLLRSQKVKDRFLRHATNFEALGAASYIWNNPGKMRYSHSEFLGARKNLGTPTGVSNVRKKMKRGVSHYNIYTFTYRRREWIVGLEQHRKGFEQFYYVVRKK